MGVTYTPPDLSELKGEINRLLEMGGTNLTDAQRIGFLVNTGLTIAEAKAQTVNKLLVQDLNSSITDVGAKLTALDFTQHGQEFEVDTDGDGIMETVDLYDYKKNQALEGLKENVIIGRLIPARMDQSPEGLALLGMDDRCISLKNQEGGSRTMESVEYRRTGFQPYG